jgi:4a-hydroxytetrahydrobiopterin dehydratase
MKLINSIEAKAILPSWDFIDNGIEKEFKFKDFNEAFAFMLRVALYSEQLNHHPDWSNSYNIVKIRLFTHSHKGLTELDIKLAQLIDGI